MYVFQPDSGGEESELISQIPRDILLISLPDYMNGFKCNVTGSTSNVPVAQSTVARRCGADPVNKKFVGSAANCTYGAKTPFYWFNNERNNVRRSLRRCFNSLMAALQMFEGTFSPPVYNNLYNFLDGAQNDIFNDSYISIPEPGIAAALPTLAHITAPSAPASASAAPTPTAASNTTIFITAASPSTTSSDTTVASSIPFSASSDSSTSTSTTPTSANAAGTTASTSPTASSAAAVITAPFGANSGYAYKRDMSNAHVLANRASSAKFRLNPESRRRRAVVRRRSWFW